MEKIRLTKDEKHVFRHVNDHGNKTPRDLSLIKFHFCLSTLQEKGLVAFKTNYDDVLWAKLTVKGAAYIEDNPKLKNPVDWKWLASFAVMSLTAIATTLALFRGCFH